MYFNVVLVDSEVGYFQHVVSTRTARARIAETAPQLADLLLVFLSCEESSRRQVGTQVPPELLRILCLPHWVTGMAPCWYDLPVTLMAGCW